MYEKRDRQILLKVLDRLHQINLKFSICKHVGQVGLKSIYFKIEQLSVYKK